MAMFSFGANGGLSTRPIVFVSDSSSVRSALPPDVTVKPWLAGNCKVLRNATGTPCATHRSFCASVGLFTATHGSLPPKKAAVGPESSSFKFGARIDRKSTRLNSSHSQISYAVFCLKKKTKQQKQRHIVPYHRR